MARPTDEISQAVAQARERIDDKVTVLETRARGTVRRVLPIAIAGLMTVAAVSIGIAVAVRRRRKQTGWERFQRALPRPVRRRLDAIELRLRRGVPPTRLYVGDRLIGDEPASSGWQKIGMRFAGAAGAALATAVITRVLERRR